MIHRDPQPMHRNSVVMQMNLIEIISSACAIINAEFSRSEGLMEQLKLYTSLGMETIATGIV